MVCERGGSFNLPYFKKDISCTDDFIHTYQSKQQKQKEISQYHPEEMATKLLLMFGLLKLIIALRSNYSN